MNSPIYSMTFIPKKRNFKLYYLAFPKSWKELLIQLQVSAYKKIRSGVLYEAVRLESMPERVA